MLQTFVLHSLGSRSLVSTEATEFKVKVAYIKAIIMMLYRLNFNRIPVKNFFLGAYRVFHADC